MDDITGKKELIVFAEQIRKIFISEIMSLSEEEIKGYAQNSEKIDFENWDKMMITILEEEDAAWWVNIFEDLTIPILIAYAEDYNFREFTNDFGIL